MQRFRMTAHGALDAGFLVDKGVAVVGIENLPHDDVAVLL